MKRKKRKGQPKPLNMRCRQKSLSQNLTSHEVIFLRRLAKANLAPFDFQVIIGYYIADFVFPTKMLIVELDGPHHSTSKAQEWDGNRDKFLTGIGFTVIRIPNAEINIWELSQVMALPHHPTNVYDDAIRWAGENRTQAFQGVPRVQRQKAATKPPTQVEAPKPPAPKRRLVPRLSSGVVPDWLHERMKEPNGKTTQDG